MGYDIEEDILTWRAADDFKAAMGDWQLQGTINQAERRNQNDKINDQEK
jgi:hypothetical protein